MISRVLERGASRRKGRAQPQHLVERDKAEDVKFKKVLDKVMSLDCKLLAKSTGCPREATLAVGRDGDRKWRQRGQYKSPGKGSKTRAGT